MRSLFELTAAIATTLILSGCSVETATLSSEDQLAVASPHSVAASALTSSATPTAIFRPADEHGPGQNVPVPAKPPLADVFSKAGIEAFANHWYEILSYGFETGDYAPLDAISDPSCIPCAKVKAGDGSWHKEGRWTVGGKVLVDHARSAFVLTPEGNYQVILSVHQTLQWFYRADGTIDELIPGSKQMDDIMVAVYKDGHWIALTAEHISGNRTFKPHL